VAVILPLYLFDHSGMTVSTTPFSCPWDSGQAGFAYMLLEEARRECGGEEDPKEWARRMIEAEVKEYGQYLSGDVWGFEIKEYDWNPDSEEWEEEGEVVESCYAFYGRDYCEEEALATCLVMNKRDRAYLEKAISRHKSLYTEKVKSFIVEWVEKYAGEEE